MRGPGPGHWQAGGLGEGDGAAGDVRVGAAHHVSGRGGPAEAGHRRTRPQQLPCHAAVHSSNNDLDACCWWYIERADDEVEEIVGRR